MPPTLTEMFWVDFPGPLYMNPLCASIIAFIHVILATSQRYSRLSCLIQFSFLDNTMFRTYSRLFLQGSARVWGWTQDFMVQALVPESTWQCSKAMSVSVMGAIWILYPFQITSRCLMLLSQSILSGLSIRSLSHHCLCSQPYLC